MPFPPCGPPDAAPADGVSLNCKPVKLVSSQLESKFVTPATTVVKPAVSQEGKSENSRNGEQARNPFLVILTAEQARSIYALRSPQTADAKDAFVAGKSSLVAEMYGVSPKTIRDVWNRKTWTQVTRSLWSEQEADLYSREHMTPEQRAALGDTELYLKRRGRPPGSKDARPRKRRFQMFEENSERPQTDEAMCIEDLKALEVSPPAACPVGQPSETQPTELEELHGPCDRSVIPACPDHNEPMAEPTHVDLEAPFRAWHMRLDHTMGYQHPFCHPQMNMNSIEGAHIARHQFMYQHHHHTQPAATNTHPQFSPTTEFSEEPGPPCEDYSHAPAEPDENFRDEEPSCPGGSHGRGGAAMMMHAKKEPMSVEVAAESHDHDGGLFSDDDENWFPGASLARCANSSLHTQSNAAAGAAQHASSGSSPGVSRLSSVFGDCGMGGCSGGGALAGWGEDGAQQEPLDGVDDFWFVLYGHHRPPSPAVAASPGRFAEDEEADEGGRLFGWCGGGA